VDVLKAAAQHGDPIVRVAAAAGVRNLDPTAASEVLTLLKNDPDAGVRKRAMKSMPESK
jgi:HEAT repeat protein